MPFSRKDKKYNMFLKLQKVFPFLGKDALLGIKMLIIMVKPIWSPSNQDRLKLFHNFIDWFAEHISGLKAKKGRGGLLA